MRKGETEAARQLWHARGGLSSRDVAVLKMLQGMVDPRDCERFFEQPLIDVVAEKTVLPAGTLLPDARSVRG